MEQIRSVVEQFESRFGPIIECKIVGWHESRVRSDLNIRMEFDGFLVDYSFKYGESVLVKHKG